MRAYNKYQLFGVNYSIVDYALASDIIIKNAIENNSFGVSALATHGLITSVDNHKLRAQLKLIDLIVPDGQPIRWALNSLYDTNLEDRVYGPTLTLHVLEKAAKLNLNVFLYGSTKDTLDRFVNFIKKNYQGINISGIHVDRFRDALIDEDMNDIKKINDSGAHIVLVGRGCPRQEEWVSNHIGKINCVMMAVGAAFDFHAGTVKQAPSWMQNNGLEWLFRLIQEPKRLWKRYFYTNSVFIYLFIKQKILKH
jgi:exopolysaccharide biosynthesis WecB/TagA/CpsF family protein|tara:strand:- start:1134 stop:1889 length:756 start_codon:yes stop_codon:yes gene_type:complete